MTQGVNDPPLNPLSIFSQIIEEIPTRKLLRFIRFSFQSRKTKTLNIIYKECLYLKSLKYFIILCMATVIISACGVNEDKTSIKLAEVTRSVFYAPEYVALEDGVFDDEGLDVELQTTWGGAKTMTSLLSDGSDVALVGAETSMYVYGQDSKDYRSEEHTSELQSRFHIVC